MKRPASLKRPAGLKRPAAASVDVSVILHHGVSLLKGVETSEEDVRQRVRDLIAHSQARFIEVSFQTRSRPGRGGVASSAFVIADSWACISCASECSVRGYSSYNKQTGELKIMSTPLDRHGQEPRRYGRREGALTDTQKQVIRVWLKENKTFRVQSLMSYLKENLPTGEVVREASVSNFVKNYRSRVCEDHLASPRAKHLWTRADFVAAAKAMPTLTGPGDNWCLAHFGLDPELAWVIISPRSICAVFDRLSCPERLALCADGCFRVVRHEAVLLSMGLVLKDSIFGKAGHSSTFVELALGFFPTESERSYATLATTLFKAVHFLRGIDMVPRVQQLHGDLADGLEAFRKRHLPDAVRTDGSGVQT
ncbi:unnamed protein product [Effrenium voratum]|nr:unnamed protein product [Effrenium voratum]